MAVETGPLIGGLVSFVSGLFFVLVGHEVSRKDLKDPERTANAGFVLWWYALGGLSIAGAFIAAAAGFGFVDLALMVAFTLIAIILICGGLWGLSYYLVFVYTGRPSLRWPLAALYLLEAVAILYLILWAEPVSVHVEGWSTQIDYRRDLSTNPATRVFGLLFILPPLLAAIGYMSLLFRAPLPSQKYRIGMVSGSILVWFGASLISSMLGLGDTEWWPQVSRAISLAAALAVFLAYRPPSNVRTWLQRQDAARDTARGVAAA